jgi:predicted RNase H-like HicB family nuclease
MEKYTILVEQDEDGILVGSAVELPGCHTQANTYDELFSRMKEAIELYREVQDTEELVHQNRFLGIQQIEV